MQKNDYETEQEFLEHYDPSIFKRPSTAVDSVIYTVLDNKLHVLLIKRDNFPFKDQWSLVGGFVDLEKDEDLEATAKRKLLEKTGVKSPYLEQYYTFGSNYRDPRGWWITTVYFALLSYKSINLKVGTGAKDIKWSPVKSGEVEEKLAFDHTKILKGCTERLKNKVLYTSLPIHLMPECFTLNELKGVYESILETTLENKSFRRRILGANILEETGEMKKTGRRPATLYRRSTKNPTHYFVRNIEGPH